MSPGTDDFVLHYSNTIDYKSFNTSLFQHSNLKTDNLDLDPQMTKLKLYHSIYYQIFENDEFRNSFISLDFKTQYKTLIDNIKAKIKELDDNFKDKNITKCNGTLNYRTLSQDLYFLNSNVDVTGNSSKEL
jgi:hypothetical protein